MNSLIQDYAPPLKWAAAQTQTVRVTPTLPSGRALGDWTTFTLTIRADPEFPRSAAEQAEAGAADPITDGWAVSTSAEGTVSGSTISFTVTIPSSAGYRRYAVDVVATGGVAGRVQLVVPYWLTVLPTLKAL